MRFKDKIVIVSGGGSIGQHLSNGRAVAIKFTCEGGKVVVVDRNFASAEETVKMMNGEGIPICTDVTDNSAVKAMVEKVISVYGRIDVLFNNVGFAWGSDILNTPDELWDRTFNVCVKSVFLVSKHVIPYMLEEGRGVIINNASVAAFLHDSMWAYNAAKSAVIKMTKDMAYEYGRKNIRVNCVVPGLIDSAIGRHRVDRDEKAAADRQKFIKKYVPLKRSGTPEEVANAVLFLASQEASYCNGACLLVDGGLVCR